MVINEDNIRVVLHPVVQKTLFEHYRILYGGLQTRAAESLDITQGRYWEYENVEIKTVPLKMFYEVLGKLRMYKDNWHADEESILEDPKYKEYAMRLAAGISGGITKVSKALSFSGERSRFGRRMAAKIAKAINDFNLCGILDIDNQSNLVYNLTTANYARGGRNYEHYKRLRGKPEEYKPVLDRMKTAREILRQMEEKNPKMHEDRMRKISDKSRKRGADVLRETQKTHGPRFNQVMSGLRLNSFKVQDMEGQGYFEIMKALDGDKQQYSMASIAEMIKENPLNVVGIMRKMKKIGYIKKAGRIGRRFRLTDRGRNVLWVYEKLKAAKRI